MQTPSATPTVLVLGANGRLGAAALQAFTAAGWQVWAQARRRPEALPHGATHLAIDALDVQGLAGAARGARAVVHALNPLYTRWQAEAMPLLHAGLDTARRLNATFMLPGNVYNFGASMPALLDAHTPQQATTRKGRIRVAMETELRSRAAQGQRSVIIRAGDFFGGGSGTWFDQVIIRSLRRGKLVYPGPLDRAHAWAYLPDLAQAFVAAASHDDLPPFADLGFAGHTLTGAELFAAIERAAAALGGAPAAGFKHARVPWPLIRLASTLLPMWREIAEMAYLWRTPHSIDGSALQRALGPLPATPLDAALRRVLAGVVAPRAQPSVQAAFVKHP